MNFVTFVQAFTEKSISFSSLNLIQVKASVNFRLDFTGLSTKLSILTNLNLEQVQTSLDSRLDFTRLSTKPIEVLQIWDGDEQSKASSPSGIEFQCTNQIDLHSHLSSAFEADFRIHECLKTTSFTQRRRAAN